MAGSRIGDKRVRGEQGGPPFPTVLIAGAVFSGLLGACHKEAPPGSALAPSLTREKETLAAKDGLSKREDEDAVRKFCASCHKFPPPETLPREKWREKIEEMYGLLGQTKDAAPPSAPSLEAAVRYYVERAPLELPLCRSTVELGPGPLSLKKIPLKLNGVPPYPGTANLKFCHLQDEKRFDLLLSEMRFGMILLIQPSLQLEKTTLLAKVPHPCHTQVVDLDQDGVRDILVADLGTVTPSDVTQGSIVWLRGTRQGTFQPIPLATGLGRVADVEAADFDGDGDLDLVVAVFGWRKVGEILYLENQTEDYEAPKFMPYVVDSRPGAIHVPVADLDQDGRPDFVALISQHFETVVAFLNKGKGTFDERVIYCADHPNWGCSGIQLVDLDGDKDLDVILSNGDSLDDQVVKPYHGVSWLENRGEFPFTAHRLTDLHGVHYAKAADLDNDGDLDIAACVFLPFVKRTMPERKLADSIIWLEQTAPGQFKQWSIEGSNYTHPTLDVADFDADGDEDIVVGNMTMAQGQGDTLENWAILLENQKK